MSVLRCNFANKVRLALWGLAWLCLAPSLWAAPAGEVTHLSGPLFAVRADGGQRVLSIRSAVESGDVLVTETNTYARIRFADAGEITLKPNSRFKVENFHYDSAKPREDSAVFGLLKGGLRAVTGAVGKRGNQDSYQIKTQAATIGIRGTQFLATVCPAEGGCGGTAPGGLYVQVLAGMVIVSNPAGHQLFTSGQFGYVPSLTTPPIILPAPMPGLPPYAPGRSFSDTVPGSGSGAPGGAESGVLVGPFSCVMP